MRLAQIWQGDFMDGARHWNGRGQGFQPPAGDAVIKLPAGAAFASLESAGAAWPKAETRSSEFRFRGYQLNKKQQPRFHYEMGEVSIEDTPVPVAGDANPTILSLEYGHLTRSLKLSAKTAPANLYFRAASGNITVAPGGFIVNGDLMISTKSKATIKANELRLPVEFKNGSAEIELTYKWAQ